MVENKGIKKDVYEIGEQSKVRDFFIGMGLFIGIGIVANLLVSPLYFFNVITPMFSIAILPLGELIFVFGCVFVYRKYFSGRRFVIVGMVSWFFTGILLAVVLLGACFIIISGMGGS